MPKVLLSVCRIKREVEGEITQFAKGIIAYEQTHTDRVASQENWTRWSELEEEERIYKYWATRLVTSTNN